MPITELQRERRRKHIGSSDVAAILNMDQFRSSDDAWDDAWDAAQATAWAAAWTAAWDAWVNAGAKQLIIELANSSIAESEPEKRVHIPESVIRELQLVG